MFPEKCDGCQGLGVSTCIEFCPHEAYAMVEGKATVVNPQNCVSGCIACRPLCPKEAIDFPGDPAFTRRKDKAWSEGLLELTCKKCGKVFWSDSEKDTRWECSSGD